MPPFRARTHHSPAIQDSSLMPALRVATTPGGSPKWVSLGTDPNQTGEPARMLPSFPEGLTTCWLPRAPPAARMAQACQNKTSETGPQGGLWLTRPYELGPLSSLCHSCATNSSLASALFSPEKHVGDNTQLGVVSLGPREPTAQRKCHQQSPCGPQER